ncbi:cytochrome c biogenesis protein CcsA [Prevotella sp. 10(H)]|uniref:cytochrome c biogenesis protein CcsA n=1 Tax=Prevotella sp. 10(H) TaxID=1158294 RepID=UPI000A49E411
MNLTRDKNKQMDVKARFNKMISSYKTTIVLLIVYALGLAIATLIEKYHGTQAAKAMIYYSPVFFLLQFFLVLNFILVTIKSQLIKKRKWGVIFIHFAFIIILAGALTSHLFSEEGSIHIRENESVYKMLVQTSRGEHYHSLPFELELKKFTLKRYPGSSSPSSFESLLLIQSDGTTVERTVSMNNVIDIKGYRLFQASYDKDEKGTILSVNKDVAGRNVTYSGYILLIVGFIFSFVGKNTRFRQLRVKLRQLKESPKVLTIIFGFLFISLSANAQDNASRMFEVIQNNKVDAEHAAKFGSLPMQTSDGRIEPINTFSSEVLRKLHKSHKIGDLNSDQFLLSVITLSEMWMRVPLFKVPNEDMASTLGVMGEECAYVNIFDSVGNYKLQKVVGEIYNKPASERNKREKDILKLDEQVNIFHQIINLRMLNIFPKENDPEHKWYAYGDDFSGLPSADSLFVSRIMPRYLNSVQNAMKSQDWEKSDEVLRMIDIFQQTKNTLDLKPKKIKAELLSNKLDIFRTCKKLYLILGGILLVLSLLALFKEKKWQIKVMHSLTVVVVLGLLFHLFGIALRWYIAGYAPWSNSYETMIYISFISVLASLLFVRQSHITFALATLFGGVILFVAGLNWMDPQIGTLVPVLKSPWLMIHVAVIVAAYGFFGISLLLGITNLSLFSVSKKNNLISVATQKLNIINEMSMLVGLALMTVGTFCGAVWANESWGRYWGWDPKETWALVTIIVYTIATHLRLVKKWDNPLLFNILSILAFLSVLMTYFGVNHFLSGMHSYN